MLLGQQLIRQLKALWPNLICRDATHVLEGSLCVGWLIAGQPEQEIGDEACSVDACGTVQIDIGGWRSRECLSDSVGEVMRIYLAERFVSAARQRKPDPIGIHLSAEPFN